MKRLLFIDCIGCVDDDDFEVQLEFRAQDNPVVDEDRSSLVPANQPEQGTSGDIIGHGKTSTGDRACCALLSAGIVDCAECIDESSKKVYDWTEEEQEATNRIIQVVEASGSGGLEIQRLVEASKNRLSSYCQYSLNTRIQTNPQIDCMRLVEQLRSLPVPILYVVGYQASLLVSARHVTPWTITLPSMKRDEEQSRSISKVFPRRWIDINGNRMTEVWEAALRAVIGHVHLRPGISHVRRKSDMPFATRRY